MANNQSVRRHLDAFTRGRIIEELQEGRSVTSVAAEFGIAHSIARRNRRLTAGEIARHRGLDARYRVLPWPEDCTVVVCLHDALSRKTQTRRSVVTINGEMPEIDEVNVMELKAFEAILQSFVQNASVIYVILLCRLRNEAAKRRVKNGR
ncbi:hypothetical protein TNCV_3888741 [Trichonephila clavipes]|nr:hypothetical protein TNCV_3888741 [Trichonephila clavipes]